MSRFGLFLNAAEVLDRAGGEAGGRRGLERKAGMNSVGPAGSLQLLPSCLLIEPGRLSALLGP
jgi:hypothetical protein